MTRLNRNGNRRYAPIVVLAAVGMMAQLTGCGASGSTGSTAPTYNSDGSPVGSRVNSNTSTNSSYASASPSYSNSNQSYDPNSSTLPNDPNGLGGNFPSASPLPNSSARPTA